MSLIRKHVAVLQAWACLALVCIVFTISAMFQIIRTIERRMANDDDP